MDFNNIKEIINVFDSSTIDKLELEDGDLKIFLERNNTAFVGANNPAVVSDTHTVTETSIKQETKISEKEHDSNYTFVSPLVGTFYAAPSPESAPYVKVGDEVKIDDVICIVEAMKMINEIKSPVNGKIVEILVQNEDLVESEQPIFKIEVI
ncbi:acetyl-CoA carboxylase biotin carboxyl carrier protein [Peptostreptococcaceae bacterium OttesenSCG-928-C18]|nr:acetyl-CoA carboxylase biotin carboxyl carrier protein [Peptostreptococcaceae bacterium OttesenSCG-928-C18]